MSDATNLVINANENNEADQDTKEGNSANGINGVNAIYNLHAKRLLYRYGAAMPVCAFA